MSTELKFIPTSMVDLESLPESVSDVIKKNVGVKICLTDGKLTSKPTLGFAFPENDKGHCFTALARSGAGLSFSEDDMTKTE